MIRLSIDLMGSDHGVAPLVQGVLLALQDDPSLSLFLIGDSRQISHHLATHSFADRIEIVDAGQVVDMQDNPVLALRSKPDSSMAVAIDMVVSGQSQGAVSAGNTGALVAFGVQRLGMLKDTLRPAICTQVPTSTGKTWLLDVGATLTANKDRIIELARLGAAQCRAFDGEKKPKVGLLNVGVEMVKGTKELQQASEFLEKETEFEYCGYVEADSIFSDGADVVVCDGFSGNVAIKTAQGVADLIAKKFIDLGKGSLISRLALSLVSSTLKQARQQLDPAQYNGAPLLGLQGLVVKSHGNADASAFANAIGVAARSLNQSKINE